jgi:hypothetical protein
MPEAINIWFTKGQHYSEFWCIDVANGLEV